MNDELHDVLRAAAEEADPSEVSVARVVRRAERTLDAPRPRPSRWRFALPLVSALGGAAIVLGVTRLLDPPGAPVVPTVPVALDATRTATASVGGDVELTYEGTGTLLRDGEDPRIRWDSGRLDVEVTPNRGVDLVVETPEGTASVVGTGFTVVRDARGTRVDVRHGVVAVSCEDGREGRLVAGQSLLCLPVRAAGMLARAKALEADGSPTSEVLDALEAGLRLEPDSGPVRAELSARRILTLARLGRDADARAAAAAWLAGGETLRREEVRALAVTLALRANDCGEALRLAEWVPTLDAAATLALADCASGVDRPRARALLAAARERDATLAPEIDARLEALEWERRDAAKPEARSP